MGLVIRKDARYDVVGIGSALLDLTVEADENFLDSLELECGCMHLIDAERSASILNRLAGMRMEVSPGGSSANTLAGVNILGGSGLFLGAVGSDAHGDTYVRETEKTGVKTSIGRYDCISGHAITFITSGSERTFATHLGAALNFSEKDVHEDDIASARILHLEGYLFESDGLYAACVRAMDFARAHGVAVSIDLSDPALIDRIHDRLHETVEKYANIVFANEEEALRFTGKREREALEALSGICDYAVVKIGGRGSLIRTGGMVYEIPAYEADVMNTNGAGDMYAAGILYGLTHGLDPERAGRIASYAASLVVARSSARLSQSIDAEDLLSRI
jgi:sugar/nucleoside kinase (ribokinase family)